MKLTLANVKKIRKETNNLLTKKVCGYVVEHWSSYSDKKHIFTDVLYYGCQSGIVSNLIRHKNTPDVPFVTVEYSLSKHKVLQCYAKSNSKPDDNVYKYIHKNWLPYANRQLKKICA